MAKSASRRVHAQLRRREHRGGVLGESFPVFRERGGWNAEEGGHSFALLIILSAVGRGERRQDKLVGQDRAVHQGGVHPAKGSDFIRLVVLALKVWADCVRQLAADPGMQLIKLPAGLSGLRAGTEEHGVDDPKGRMEATDGIVQQGGMLGQGCGHPGMSQLQERRTSGTEKDSGLAVHPPGNRARSEEPIAGFARQLLE